MTMKFSPKYNQGSAPTYKMDGMDREEVATIYFALREYRDNLNKTLMEVQMKDLCVEDHEVDPKTPLACGCCTVKDVAPEGIVSEVPQVKPAAYINSCVEFEELAFLHETLYKVNSALFEIVDNHEATIKDAILHHLDVI